jgi:uncharacterized phage protein (TIGR01671 family)
VGKGALEMRELKFRTWFEDTNEVTKPWTICDVSEGKDPNFGFIRKEPFGAGTGGTAVGGIYLSQVRNHRIMQYTGLKDKNGKEIYEGDILSCFSSWITCNKSNRIRRQELQAGIVTFKFGHFRIEDEKGYCIKDIDDEEDLQIIGNIYQTPEIEIGKIDILSEIPMGSWERY